MSRGSWFYGSMVQGSCFYGKSKTQSLIHDAGNPTVHSLTARMQSEIFAKAMSKHTMSLHTRMDLHVVDSKWPTSLQTFWTTILRSKHSSTG